MSDDRIAGDCFETVAFVYSQPETAVMLSMFAFYGIPAYAFGVRHAGVAISLTLALGGIQVRVHPEALGEARDLLREVATRAPVFRPRLIANPVVRGMAYVLLLFMTAVPPRIASEFLLDPQ